MLLLLAAGAQSLPRRPFSLQRAGGPDLPESSVRCIRAVAAQGLRAGAWQTQCW